MSKRERLDDPFEPEMILVQSTGMAQWLQMTLSQKFGIAANIDFSAASELYLGYVRPGVTGDPQRERL
ncbi:exodeoxyribonuclease V gamma subunit [Escherichia coli]|uniref:Exodeoxyribonuclease V gamma subunit n=1 Tax=Escherichia coli TaxID=562 RepID=A0A376KMJ5_ECOLX|nr:exodeoxyribonuclease V gamma subunit [Escherichia coli]